MNDWMNEWMTEMEIETLNGCSQSSINHMYNESWKIPLALIRTKGYFPSLYTHAGFQIFIFVLFEFTVGFISIKKASKKREN